MTDFVDTNALAYSGRALPAARQAELVSRWGWWFQAERRLLGMKAYWTTIAGEAVLTPLLYLIAMGVGLGRLVDAGSGGVAGVPYLAFVGPGVLVASTVMTATGEFTYGVMDGFKWSKIYFARSATAASPWQVAVGELLAVGLRFLAQSLVFWLMLVGFGVAGWGSWAIALVAPLAALAFGAPLMAFSAAQTDEGTQFTMIQRFVVAPMFLFAGTFFPLESMPVYLQWIGWISPMWHGTQVAQAGRLMLKQALRELRFHPSRFVATLIATAISVAFMVTSSIMVATQRDALAVDQAEAAYLAEEFDTFRNLLWTFAGIAAVVGMITIANTFTILLAQRRRQIGLLRAVGAEGSQVRRRFFLEAVLLGLAGSLVGVALGVGLSAIGATVTGAIRHGLSVPAGDLGIAFAAGLLITVLAAYLPVLRGTRVRPLEALQPEPSADERRKAGLARAVVCGVLFLAGVALGVWSTQWENPLLPAIAGSVLVALGVLFGASLFVPHLLRLLGSLVGRLGVTPRLAAQNAVRNPRRASTTSAALMLAVGLVVTLQVGTATVRATMLGQIDHQRPVDVSVASWEVTRTLPADLVSKLVAVPGVAGSALLPVQQAELTHGGEVEGLTVLGFEQAITGVAVGAPRSLPDDKVLVTDDSNLFVNGDLVTIKGERGTVELTAVRTPLVTNGQVMVSPATFAKLGTGTPDALLWLSVPDRSQAVPVVHAVEQLADPDSYFIAGGVQSAAAIAEVLDLLLYITTALLGVAVFIALVGVSNTLGLSVLERTRESALLRAVGLQARSLRVMMLVEALLLAVVAVAVGIVAGIYFGWLGARSLAIGIDAPLLLTVDVPQTTGMVVIAIVAAALASVLPGRRAAKASPVEALADV